MSGIYGLVTVAFLVLSVFAIPFEDVGTGHIARRALYSRNNGVHVRSYKPAPIVSSRTPSRSSSHTMTLKRRSHQGPNTRSAGHHLQSRSQVSGTATMQSLKTGTEYVTSIMFGDQTFEVVVDTGSSDTWVPQAGFDCYDQDTEQKVTVEDCAFGPELYTPSSTFKRIPGEDFYVSYADGEWGWGYMGKENVTLAGISVNQEVGVMNRAAWSGDNITSGLVGLAYPAMTGARSNVTQEEHHYSPIFTTMYKQGLVDSYFTLLLSRNVSGDAGYLTLGGLPPVDFKESWTSTDILVTNVNQSVKGLDFYTINIDDVTVGGRKVKKSGGKHIQYIVDSGTTYNYYPNDTARAVNQAFNPPAIKQDDGSYTVNCDATPPAHAITINGTSFEINPLDMISVYGQDDDGNNLCQTQFFAGGADPREQTYILGDTFLKNVVAIFDVGAAEMRFAPNSDYESNAVI